MIFSVIYVRLAENWTARLMFTKKMMRRFVLIAVALCFAAVHLPAQSGSVMEMMHRLEKEYDVRFVYDSSIAPRLEEKAGCYSGDNLEAELESLFAGTGISWKLSNKYIVLRTGASSGSQGKAARFTVSGYMTDSASGEVLIGAGVTDGIYGAVSNNYGHYSFSVPAGMAVLTYSYVGCTPQVRRLDLRRDTVINVSLVQSAGLEASRIVSRKDAGIASTYMGALEVPSRLVENTPAVLGEPDVLKTVQMMPGVQGGMAGFSGIYIRGGGADENLTMLDGAPLYNVSHLFGLLSVFTPESVKKVTLYKGSFPSRYGGRVSGILDVRTNDGNANGLHGSVSAGLLSSKLHFEGPLGGSNTTFFISGRGMHTFLFDQVIKLADGNFNYAFYDINAKVSHRFSGADRINAAFYLGRDYYKSSYCDKFSERYYGPDYEPFTRLTKEEGRTGVNWGNTVGVLRWNHVFSGRLFMDASAYVNRYGMKTSSYNDDWEENADGVFENTVTYRYFSSIFDVGVRADFDYAPVPEHLVKFGGEYVRHAFRPETEVGRQEYQDLTVLRDTSYRNSLSSDVFGGEMSLYLEDDISIGSCLTFNPGVRLSLFHAGKKAYFRPEPRVSARYSSGKGWAVKAAYSRMSQYVHQLASGNISLPTDLWVPITDDIEPVSSDIVSLGAYYDGLKGWEFSLEGYWKKLDNVLEYKDGKRAFTSSTDWEKNVSSGEGRSYGAELYIQKTEGNTTGSLSYTISKSERIFRDGSVNNGNWFPFAYDRRHDICICVNRRFGSRYDLSAAWGYDSGGWMTVPDGYTYVMMPDGHSSIEAHIPSRNNYHLPPSHRLDVSLNIHRKTRRGESIWNVGMCNVYGARNPDFVLIDRVEFTDKDMKLTRPAVSIWSYIMFLPSFSYTYRF